MESRIWSVRFLVRPNDIPRREGWTTSPLVCRVYGTFYRSRRPVLTEGSPRKRFTSKLLTINRRRFGHLQGSFGFKEKTSRGFFLDDP